MAAKCSWRWLLVGQQNPFSGSRFPSQAADPPSQAVLDFSFATYALVSFLLFLILCHFFSDLRCFYTKEAMEFSLTGKLYFSPNMTDGKAEAQAILILQKIGYFLVFLHHTLDLWISI